MYPRPTAVKVTPETSPFVSVAVANAVDPIPVVVPEPIGGVILIDGTNVYPLPALVISISVIVPAAETMAVAAALTLIVPDVISASISLIVILYFILVISSTWVLASIWSPFS